MSTCLNKFPNFHFIPNKWYKFGLFYQSNSYSNSNSIAYACKSLLIFNCQSIVHKFQALFKLKDSMKFVSILKLFKFTVNLIFLSFPSFLVPSRSFFFSFYTVIRRKEVKRLNLAYHDVLSSSPPICRCWRTR